MDKLDNKPEKKMSVTKKEKMAIQEFELQIKVKLDVQGAISTGGAIVVVDRRSDPCTVTPRRKVAAAAKWKRREQPSSSSQQRPPAFAGSCSGGSKNNPLYWATTDGQRDCGAATNQWAPSVPRPSIARPFRRGRRPQAVFLRQSIGLIGDTPAGAMSAYLCKMVGATLCTSAQAKNEDVCYMQGTPLVSLPPSVRPFLPLFVHVSTHPPASERARVWSLDRRPMGICPLLTHLFTTSHPGHTA
uniref:Uncharacterized protein n=1 Tax=Plectus sambesii TaxID=2011161 RepID=A0A914VBC3_9BILA